MGYYGNIKLFKEEFSMSGKTCQICGKQSGMYPLCKEHLTMKANGAVIKCETCGIWFKTELGCANCKTQKAEQPKYKTITTPWSKPKKVETQENVEKINTYEICIICGEQSNGKPQCKNCYNETKSHMDSLDKNSSVRKLRDYYYNLKERILIIKSLEEAQNQCNKLIAIAMVEQNINDDTSLMDRVYKDTETLIKGKQAPVQNPAIEEERKEKDEHKSKINTAQDGHNVDSDMEVRIDDILYNSFILHCYGKSIDEITEKRKKCDWFIPIANGKGIYIEYWGMKTPKYLEERKEKEELYKKHNIPYISIEQDDPKQDTQTFKSNLIRELTALAIDRFGFMPEWKK